MSVRRGIAAAQAALARGEISSLGLTQSCLQRIADPAGQGARAFLTVYAEAATAAAAASDARRREHVSLGPLDGVPVSIKDLFDVAGEPTRAGSRVLAHGAPAAVDAAAVARLRAAGAVILGKTNMTEFAYSGLGANPHFGTPLSPFERDEQHVPGGSSSGAAVSVADGMALAAIGTDTGGSTRIPAAFCGLAGFKPTRGRVPAAGCFPLAPSFDTIGPIAVNAADCRLLDTVLSGTAAAPRRLASAGLRLGITEGLPVEELAAPVAAAYEAALNRLREAGATLLPVRTDWRSLLAILADGRITACECLAAHGALFAERALYDPNVAQRIAAAEGFPAIAYIAALARLQTLRGVAWRAMSGFDAILLPTVAALPPKLSEIADPLDFTAWNLRVLRNTSLVNLLDGCAISLPLPAEAGAPVGMMLMTAPRRDAHLFDVAASVEPLICKSA